MSRWLTRGAAPDLESVRAVCRALGVPAVAGMLAAGLLAPEDVDVTVVERHRGAHDLSNRELLAELGRRLAPDDEQVPVEPPMVSRIAPRGVEGEDWAARRRPRPRRAERDERDER